MGLRPAAQRAKFSEKVHKPPLWVNVITFELNALDASIWVPWSPSDPKKFKINDIDPERRFVNLFGEFSPLCPVPKVDKAI